MKVGHYIITSYSDGILFLSHPVSNSPPENVSIMFLTSSRIMVSWDAVPPEDRNGIITMYEVLYQLLETFEGAITTQTMNVTERSANLTDLEEFVNYTISVRAYTSVGAGNYSSEITVLTLEDGNV